MAERTPQQLNAELREKLTEVVKLINEWLDLVEPPRPLKTLSPEELKPTVGEVLKVTDPDPVTPATFSYRWRRP